MRNMGEGGDPSVFQRQLHRHPVAAGGVMDTGRGIGGWQMAAACGIGRQPQQLAAIEGIAEIVGHGLFKRHFNNKVKVFDRAYISAF
jgi:hypothetical protein